MAGRRSGRWSAGITGAALGIAAGTALGAYVLAPEGGIEWGGGAAAQERDAAIAQLDAATTRADSANAVVEDLSAQVVDGSLDDVPVLLVVAPDARAEAVDAMAATLRDAGAPDAGRLELTGKFLSAESADELKDVVTGALPAGTQLDVNRLDPGFQAGQALSPVLLLGDDGESRASTADRALLLGALRDSGFIGYEDGTMRPAAAIVVVAGAGEGPGDDPAFGARILADVTGALAADGTVVVAGDPESASDDGVVALIGAAEPASPVKTQSAIGDIAGRVGVIRDIVVGESAGEAAADPAGE